MFLVRVASRKLSRKESEKLREIAAIVPLETHKHDEIAKGYPYLLSFL